MPVHNTNYESIITELGSSVTLVAVSKTKPIEDIQELYSLGQRHFGENYVQELVDKHTALPADIQWHFIGHLQTNKVKFIVPFVHLVQGVDSTKLLQEINKQAAKTGRVVQVLLQVHIAREETKFGLSEEELGSLFSSGQLASLPNISIKGLMGMASMTDDKVIVKKEFAYLKSLYDKYAPHRSSNVSFEYLSMGMSGDYQLAIAEGSTMVRIGSLLFGARNTTQQP